jgi:hypothetical protein
MRTILLICFAFSSIVASSQNFVSTSPENKNIILEEYTGITCGYCPDGHKIGQALHDANPNDVFLVNIHTGGYASPQGPGTDFRVDPFGANLGAQTGLTGYPSGTVNRHIFSGSSTALGRSVWGSSSTQLLSQSSPVNVGVQASVDMATNLLTVEVEVYYTGSQTVTSNMLNVVVVQNNIEGPQSGGASLNPASMLPNGNYNHNHMLRHMMTGNWGEMINDISQGSLYTKQYTWDMPADINGVSLDPTNIAVIAFVAEGQQEILSGTEFYPSIIFANQNDAYCMSSSANDAICGTSTDLEVTFRNYGAVPLTSLDINYSINGGTSSTYAWTGNLASAAMETITIPGVAFSPQATNNVLVSTTNPNGVVDQNTSNDQSNGSFSQFSAAGQVTSGVISGTANIDIVTDQYGSETTWELTDDAGNLVASGGPYGNLSASGTTVQPTVNVNLSANECYSFLIKDSYGDGINTAQYGQGSFTVTDAGGNAFITGGVFSSEVRESFNANGSATSINNNSEEFISVYPNPAKDKLTIKGIYDMVEIHDVYGKKVFASDNKEELNISKLSSGIYFVNIKISNLITVQKITVTK